MHALRVKEISAGIGLDRVFGPFYVVVSFEGIYTSISRGIDLNLAMMNLVFLPCHIINNTEGPP